MKTIIDYLRKTKKLAKEPLIVHNDLPTNDWASLFQLLTEDSSYNGVASGRTFYEQCLPSNSLSIGHSSTALHWLSKKPCNLSNHCYIGFDEDLKEYQAFKELAYLDYSQFLRHRSCELVPGGVLILTILCTNNQGRPGIENILNLLYECAQLLPFTAQELLDFTIPMYFRSSKECIDEHLFAQYSFELIKSEFVSIESPFFKQWKEAKITLNEFCHLTTSFVRAWSESILRQVLMNSSRIQDDVSIVLKKFWDLFEEKIREHPETGNFSCEYGYVVLKKKSTFI